MTKNWTEWACEHGQITEICSSEGCGYETIPMTWQFGTAGVDLMVIWEMSDKETIVTTEPVIAQKEPYARALKAGETYAWCACGRGSDQPFLRRVPQDTLAAISTVPRRIV